MLDMSWGWGLAPSGFFNPQSFNWPSPGLHRCLLEAAFAGCDQQVEEIWSLTPEFPKNEHMCGELFRQLLHNKFHVLYQLFPRRKRRLMRYAQVPTTESSPGLTINFAAILLFACLQTLLFSLLPLSSLILHNSCMPFCSYLFVSWTVYYYFFMLFVCGCQPSNKEFTYLLT